MPEVREFNFVCCDSGLSLFRLGHLFFRLNTSSLLIPSRSPFLPPGALVACNLHGACCNSCNSVDLGDAASARYAPCPKAKAWLAPTSGLAAACCGLLVGASLPKPDPRCCPQVRCLRWSRAASRCSTSPRPRARPTSCRATSQTRCSRRYLPYSWPCAPRLPPSHPAPAPLPLAPGLAGRPQAAAGHKRGERAQRARDLPRLRPRRQDAHLRLARQVDRSVGCRAPRRRGRCPLATPGPLLNPLQERTCTYWSSSH